MGIEALIQALKQTIVRITKEMRLQVNPDSEMYEEQESLPMDRDGEPWDMGEEPEIEEDFRAEMEPNRRKEKRTRAPMVFVMNTPDRSDQISMVPYILIQFLEGKDARTSDDKGYKQYATAKVRVLVATYNEDGQQGGLQVLDILERIRLVCLRGIMLLENYTLKEPLEYQVYPDDTGRYFLGEMDMTWEIPTIDRDCVCVETAVESGSIIASGLIEEESIWNEMSLRP